MSDDQLLMLGGIALLGIVTTSLASWLLDRIREVEPWSQAATRQNIHLLMRRLDELQLEVASLRQPRQAEGTTDST